jgi:uncharacterized protein (DUF1499 family)
MRRWPRAFFSLLLRPMHIVRWLLIAVVVLVVVAVVAGQAGALQGRAPQDLGVRDGRLKAPSDTPNSVTSQAALYPAHPLHAEADIAPLPLGGGDAAATLARIRAIAEAMPGATVVKAEGDYLYLRFTTRLMRFVDDTEFWVDPAARVIQVRSASRVGRKDFGVNRARIEAIRAKLAGG